MDIKISELIYVILICIILGYLSEMIIAYKNNDNTLTKIKKQNKLYFIFMLIIYGCIFHIFIEFIGLNKWQCEKKCYIDGTCQLICKKNI